MKYPLVLFALLLPGLIAACAAEQATPGPAAANTLTLTSPAFAAGEAIPQKYTCQGEDSSPALQWSAAPAGTQSLALLMEDPDAPLQTWVHWLVYNLPAETNELVEGASQANRSTNQLPPTAVQGKTSFGRTDYGGPCPPTGQHHYHFHLYALDILLEGQGLDKPAFLEAIDGHVLAQGELIGVYQK